ncbi:MAG UNVERIFIED_CONTAM: hypothetical protein LVR29_05450 [Microcystis novacekii LVE1205-3]
MDKADDGETQEREMGASDHPLDLVAVLNLNCVWAILGQMLKLLSLLQTPIMNYT